MIKEKSVVVTNDGEYELYDYQSERELEDMIVEHSKKIFGEDTYYIDVKKRIHSKAGFGTEPDGYVIDFEKKKLYVVEVELTRHSLDGHVLPQISKFIMALRNNETYNKLAKMFKEELSSVKNMSDEEIKSIIDNREIVIVIDNIGDPNQEHNKLFEVVDFLSEHNEVVRAIPFRTYVKGCDYSQDHVHSFKAFTREGLKKEAKKWNFKWGTVSVEKHLEKLNDDSKEIFKELGERICCIASGDINEVHRKTWTTYQISKLGNFCTVKFPKGCLEVYMKVDKDTFEDEKNITRDIERTPAWTFDKAFTIKSRDDVDYAISLIRQAYHFMCECKK